MDISPCGRVIDMKYEQNRFNTFFRSVRNRDLPRFQKFARAGFRVVNGQIVCFVCNLSLGSEFLEEDIFEHHKTKNPYCSFVKGDADNVPMSDMVSNSGLVDIFD
jgi:hypothetical protein